MNASTISNDDSILESIKQLLGVMPEQTEFDTDILTFINGCFLDLEQLGVGPEGGFSIMDKGDIWYDFADSDKLLSSVKPYIYLKVRLIFDSSSLTSSVIASFEKMIERFEWRINMAVELDKKTGEEE